jgi:hypothetical protein
MIRLFRRILLVSAALVVLCLTTLAVLAYAYQDEVKARLIAELNAHIKAPVHQSGIELTLIERFPQASLRITDVFVQEVRTDSVAADTLLTARNLYLEFSLLSMLRGDYTVSELHGEDVRLYPALDSNGAENWLIWRTDSASSGGTDLKLKKMTFDGLVGRFRDHRNGLEVSSHSQDMAFRGRFRDEGSALTIEGDIRLDHWTNTKGTVLADRKADVKLKLGFGGADGAFRIEKGSEVLLADRDGKAGDAPVSITLAVERGPKGQTLDLRANGFNMDLAEVAALLPEGLHRRVRHYDLGGAADVAIHFVGPLDGEGPSLSAGMNVRDGRLKESSSGATFTEVRGELALELTPEGSVRRLLVKGLQASTASGSIGGDIDLSGLTNAKLQADIHADLALADLMRFARVDTLEEAQGRLKADAHVTGKLRDVAHVKPADLRALAVSGNAELQDASLKLKGVRHRITGLNARLALKGNDAQVDGLRCEVQGNAIELNGTLRNLMPYLLFPDQRLVIDARGASPRLDLAALISTNEISGDDNSASGDYVVKFPALIDLDLRATVDELVFEDFAAQKIVGTITLQDRVLSISPLSFRSADGTVSGSLRLDGRPIDAYPISIAAEVEHIDITRLFGEFRNFGQSFITDKHLHGNGDVRLTLTAMLSPALKLDQNSLHCIAGLAITNGQLNDHAPMIAVADYLRANKLVSPFVDTDELKKRLTHVTFAKLENQIEIKDRTVYVPQMLVQSSAMDIEVSGAQTFDGGVDDHLNFRLADLFRTNGGADEFGPVVDDGTGMRLFLHMYGTTSDLQFKSDGAAASARRKEKMKQETAELKGILADIWHGNGGLAPEPVSRPIITVEGADPEKQDTNGANPTGQVPKKKGLGRLLEKAGKEDEDEEVIILE